MLLSADPGIAFVKLFHLPVFSVNIFPCTLYKLLKTKTNRRCNKWQRSLSKLHQVWKTEVSSAKKEGWLSLSSLLWTLSLSFVNMRVGSENNTLNSCSSFLCLLPFPKKKTTTTSSSFHLIAITVGCTQPDIPCCHRNELYVYKFFAGGQQARFIFVSQILFRSNHIQIFL